MKTYTTVSGDMWDHIAYKQYGSSAYVGKLYKANTEYRKYYKLPAGLKLNIPDLDEKDVTQEQIAPWRR